MPVVHPITRPPGAERPLVVTADPDLLDDLLRLAATAGTQVQVAADAASARTAWPSAPLVLLGPDVVDGCAGSGLARRPDVVLVATDLDDAGVWQQAVSVGAEHVAFLPDAERWLSDRLADAAEGAGPAGVVVGVVGGRGGAGATTLACALAVTAARTGSSVLLVDGDPLGGGIDLVFGEEGDGGVRWRDFVATRGRVPAGVLAATLPRTHGLSVLSWDRGDTRAVPAQAVESVLTAGRRAHDLVVVDLPRSLDEASRVVLAAATTVLLVVPDEVRAAAAASRVAAAVGVLCHDLRVVTRGPSPTGLSGAQVARALGLPLVGDLRAEPGLDVGLERGDPPGLRPRSPLAQLCAGLLDELLQPLRRAA